MIDYACDIRYHHTCPVTLFLALREALALFVAEGLEASWRRHEEAALRLRAALPRLGLGQFVADPAHRVPTLTGITFHPSLDWATVVRTAMARSVSVFSGFVALSNSSDLRLSLIYIFIVLCFSGRYGVEISAGLGPTAGKILRIGLMGINANAASVDLVIQALEDSINNPVTCKL